MKEKEEDPIMDEVYAVRHEISSRFGNDPKRYIESIREMKRRAGEVGLSFLEYCRSNVGTDALFVTGITSTSELPVVTTVEQSLAQPNAASWRAKDGIVAVNGAVRYELPSNAQVRIEERSGSWRRHMGSMPDQRATGRVFEITVPHGVKPSAASCAWRVRPCALSVP